MKTHKNQKGLTIIEAMIVISLIGILAAALIPILFGEPLADIKIIADDKVESLILNKDSAATAISVDCVYKDIRFECTTLYINGYNKPDKSLHTCNIVSRLDSTVNCSRLSF